VGNAHLACFRVGKRGNKKETMSERDLSNGTNTPGIESASHQENTAVKDNHE